MDCSTAKCYDSDRDSYPCQLVRTQRSNQLSYLPIPLKLQETKPLLKLTEDKFYTALFETTVKHCIQPPLQIDHSPISIALFGSQTITHIDILTL